MKLLLVVYVVLANCDSTIVDIERGVELLTVSPPHPIRPQRGEVSLTPSSEERIHAADPDENGCRLCCKTCLGLSFAYLCILIGIGVAGGAGVAIGYYTT